MLTLEIITPDETVLNTKADEVVLPTESGETGILPGHIPIFTNIVAGELRFTKKGRSESIAIDHGFAKVLGNTVLVLTESAIDVKEIDLAEVEAAQVRAEEALRIAEEEGYDPEELESLEANTRYLLAQKLIKGRR